MSRFSLTSWKAELCRYTPREKWFFFFAMICGFCITFEGAITKPVSNSIFITHYTVHLFPYAWLAAIPLNLLVVSFYNRFISLLGYFKTFFIAALFTIGIHLLSAFFISKIPFLPFFLCVWKDLYILLMFQHLWSIINSVTTVSRAKYLYGILCGAGGCGSILGSMVPGFFAVEMGSQYLLIMTLPTYVLFIIVYFFLIQKSNLAEEQAKQQFSIPSFHALKGLNLIRNSKILQLILGIVVLMQLSATVIEFQFNTLIADIFPDQDMRTAFYGKIWGLTNVLTLFFQFIGSFLLIEFFGLKGSHFVLPMVLLCNTSLSLLFPGPQITTYCFSMIKSLDYSFFTVIKEILYVPLKREDKFKAKAIIDIFSYRTARALASFLVLGIQFLFPHALPNAFSWIPFGCLHMWLLLLFNRRKTAPLVEPFLK